MNTAGTTGNPEKSAYDKAVYDRAKALLAMPLSLRKSLIENIARTEGEKVAKDIDDEYGRIWESRQARLNYE